MNGGIRVKLRKLYLTNNLCYMTGKKHTPKGVMVHSTGANNPRLSRYVGPDDGMLGPNPYNNHWNQPTPGGRKVCPHAFIGKLKDGSIATYQTLPWDMAGWHSGSGSLGLARNANNTGYIGFEICEDGLADPVYFSLVYREAVELAAYLCALYDIRPVRPYLIDHSEGHFLGIASNHADVMHWFPRHGKSMDSFRADVEAEMAKFTDRELLKAVARISDIVPGGIDVLMWSGSNKEWKAKYVDTLLLKIANALE
jgi:hypothetical protein